MFTIALNSSDIPLSTCPKWVAPCVKSTTLDWRMSSMFSQAVSRNPVLYPGIESKYSRPFLEIGLHRIRDFEIFLGSAC